MHIINYLKFHFFYHAPWFDEKLLYKPCIFMPQKEKDAFSQKAPRSHVLTIEKVAT